MSFKRIKYDGKEVVLELHDSPNPKRDVEQLVTSREAPHKDFVAAFREFLRPALEFCELEEDYAGGLRVQSVSISRDKDGNRGCVVTMLKQLDAVPAPLVLNTPHVTERADGEGECTMPGEFSTALDRLEREAWAFLNGKREQSDLFAENTERGLEVTVGAGA